MPELPDVEIYKQYFEEHFLNKKVKDVEVLNSKVAPDFPKQALIGHTFTEASRTGKYLMAKLDHGKILSLHFGMTGFLKYTEAESPEYTHFIIHFENGSSMAFSDTRKLGHINVFDNATDFISNYQLGPDALEISKEAFLALVLSKSGMIKSTLTNQKYIAGIGNVYADEILYQASIHPQTRCKSLSNEEVEHLYHCMRDVLTQSIKASAIPDNLPKNFLTPKRGEQDTCPEGRGSIKKLKVAGRSTYICSENQKIKK
ncbi:DNA-formamidopyrimidine glycosylase family protein [Cytophagaceae bacterium ABcell3]|nr:DNA-formamidopyrimidine glycosylase family protein [Cytophagaceae bacterium ABcell3]